MGPSSTNPKKVKAIPNETKLATFLKAGVVSESQIVET